MVSAPASALDVHAMVELLVARCRAGGQRRTHALVMLLETLVRANGPVSLRKVTELAGRSLDCNPATLYRLLARLEERGIVRRVGLHDRAAHYILPDATSHRDYLVCIDCGEIAAIDVPCPVQSMEDDLAAHTGYQGLYHELQFYGRCPQCITQLGSPAPVARAHQHAHDHAHGDCDHEHAPAMAPR